VKSGTRVTDKRIGVLMGGDSTEREVSLASGKGVFEALCELGYNVTAIETNGPDLASKLLDNGIQLAFIALHGGSGENGAVQGLLEVMGIPYTGSGVMASAIAMDKVMSKIVFQAAGLSVPPYRVIDSASETAALRGDADFGPPWVVKPSREGSSVGVTIVEDEKNLSDAFDEAFRFGPPVLIERYIAGKEVQIGVLGGRALGGVEVRPKKSFYDYECKYTGGMTDYILPPQISDGLYSRLNEAALKAHGALGCRVYSRVDFRVDEREDIFLLEVNTLPGMTPTSLMPKIALQAGIGFGELLEEIIGASLK